MSKKKIDLAQLGVSIRDFGDVKYVLALTPSDDNFASIQRALDEYGSSSDYYGNSKTVAA